MQSATSSFLAFSLLIALVACVPTSFADAAADNLFMQPNRYSIGGSPTGIATADFNGDGKDDLVAASGDEASASVLLGNGDGTFHDGERYETGTGAVATYIATGDFDGDDAPDFIVTNIDDSSLSVFLNNGDGTFQAPATFSTGTGPVVVKTADFDNDDILDLAASLLFEDAIAIHLGNGDGTFQAGVTYATGSGPINLAIANLNAGAVPDLAVANNGDATVSIFLGNGDGTFAAKVDYAVGGLPLAVAPADFNNNGAIDLAVTNSDDATVSVLLGNGNGTFQAQFVYEAGDGPAGIAAGDFNDDGAVDVVSAGDNNGAAWVLLGLGDGTLEVMDGAFGFGTGVEPADVVVADFDDDGALDVAATTNADSGTVSVALGNGDGTFSSWWSYKTGGGTPHTLAVTDFNLDHKRDVVVANYDDGTFTTLLGDPGVSGIFRRAFQSDELGEGVVDAEPGLLNGDAYPDLAVTHEGEDLVYLYMGVGDGTFGTPATSTTGVLPQMVSIEDYDADGDRDLAIVNQEGNSVSILLGNGNGTFAAKVDYAVVDDEPVDMIAADFNSDNLPDLATSNFSDLGTISVLINSGDGTFQDAVTYPARAQTYGIAAGDFDRNGDEDIVATNYTDETASVFLGNGDGTFQESVEYAMGGRAVSSVTVADFDGDGCLDFAAHSLEDNDHLLLRLGDCEGAFPEFAEYFVGGPSLAITSADVNDDNKPDLLFLAHEANTLSVLINDAPPARHRQGGGGGGGSSGGSSSSNNDSPASSGEDVVTPPTPSLPSFPLLPTLPTDPATLQHLVSLLTQLIVLLQEQLSAQS